MREEQYPVEPRLLKDFSEARADLARHGIVIVRTVETELEPALMRLVKDSLSASPKKLARIDEEELDKFLAKVRREAIGSANELKALYVKLLSKLGRSEVSDIVDELEGIGELFKWPRIEKTAEPVNKLLEKEGFHRAELTGPSDVSEALQKELDEKWPAAFERFRALAEEFSREQSSQAAEETRSPQKTKRPQKRG